MWALAMGSLGERRSPSHGGHASRPERVGALPGDASQVVITNLHDGRTDVGDEGLPFGAEFPQPPALPESAGPEPGTTTGDHGRTAMARGPQTADEEI